MIIKIAFLTTIDGDGNPQIGDCIVITFNEDQRKACIIVDGGYGSNKKVLKNYLENENVEIIDLMVASHIDNDHISGLKAFLIDYVLEKDGKKNKFDLRNYWGPASKGFEKPISITEFISYFEKVDDFDIEELSFISKSVDMNQNLYDTVKNILDDEYIFHPSVQVSDSIPIIFKNLAIDILAPDKQIPDYEIKEQILEEVSLGDTLVSDLEIDFKDEVFKNKLEIAASEKNHTANNQSIVIKLTPFDNNGDKIENCSILLTGDAEKDSWDFMLPQWNDKLKSELLKVSHHGSENGTNIDILNIVNPKYCVICAGNNSKGLPDEKVFKMINKKNIDIFCTGLNINKEKGPCIKDNILKKCPRWDDANDIPIKENIIFKMDTDSSAINYTGNPCGFNWK